MRVAPGAWRLAAVPFVLAPVGAAVFMPLAVVAVLLGGFVLWFHRDPSRETPPTGFVAPADGTVTTLQRHGDRLRVGIFMNVDDVHVVRAPAEGALTEVAHKPGAHWPAFTKASAHNERLKLTAEHSDEELTLVLIAGAFARRIHPYHKPPTTLTRGQRVGHISFGSRVDVLFPPSVSEADLTVGPGDPVRAGETVVATA